MKKRLNLEILIAINIILIILMISCKSQLTHQTEAPAELAAFSPERKAFNAKLMNQLKLPAGFKINVFASDLINPRMIAVNADGTVYITQPKNNSVIKLKDTNYDGVADKKQTVITNLKEVHGVTIYNYNLYLATPREVYIASINQNGTIRKLKRLINDLPEGGRHPNRTLGFGPDGMLYISVGSSCDACKEKNEEYATILQANPDGSMRKIYAEGLRNTLGFDWNPTTGEMWGMDQGSDWRGGNIPPEELNKIIYLGNYGWPWCYGEKQIDQKTPGGPQGTTKKYFCLKSIPAALTYQAHSSPIGFTFYTGAQFPKEYNNDAFVTFRGSWNRKPPAGYKIARVRFENGKPIAFEDFLTGFLINNGTAQFARIAGIAVAKDGSLLVADDENGVIYRISYSKP